jgi:hypothetical protein
MLRLAPQGQWAKSPRDSKRKLGATTNFIDLYQPDTVPVRTFRLYHIQLACRAEKYAALLVVFLLV